MQNIPKIYRRIWAIPNFRTKYIMNHNQFDYAKQLIEKKFRFHETKKFKDAVNLGIFDPTVFEISHSRSPAAGRRRSCRPLPGTSQLFSKTHVRIYRIVNIFRDGENEDRSA